MVEHQTFNLGSSGSSPEWHTYPTIEESAGNFGPRRNDDRIKLDREQTIKSSGCLNYKPDYIQVYKDRL